MRNIFSFVRKTLGVFFLAGFLLATNSFAANPDPIAAILNDKAAESADAVTAEIVAHRNAATPSSPYEVGILLKHKEGWHTYWENPGDVGEATKIEWTLPRHWKITPLGWPLPKVKQTGGLTSYIYDGNVLLPFRIEVPWGTPYGTRVTIRAKVSWVACHDICVPQEATLKFSVPIEVASKPTEADSLFKRTQAETPESVTTTAISAIQDGERICIQLPQSAGLISESIVLLPKAGNPFSSQVSTISLVRGQNTTLLLTLKEKSATPLSTIEGILVADGGPLQNGWAIDTKIAVRPGKITSTEKVTKKKKTTRSILLTPQLEPVQTITSGRALLFAFFGGLILNLMPCVFPVLSLKVLNLADRSRRRGTMAVNGLAFMGGVLATTLALAALLLFVRSLGFAVGWGFQLQTPWVVATLALLFFAITLNLLGVFEFTAASHLADSRAAKALPTTGPAGSFCVGILTVVVASPCTAPFMGAALGYAVTQPALQASAVFLALGFGIGLPWFLLTIFPGWTRWLPRPGAWMLRLKRFMALPMFIAFMWLVWVLAHQVNIYGLITLFLGAGGLTLFLWVYGREQYGRGNSRILKVISLLVTLASMFTLAYADFSKVNVKENSVWQEFSTSAVERALHEGRPVIIDFTASWCVTCQFNKVTALHTDATNAALNRYGYRRFIADWTSRDAQITRALNVFGRTGVPLYVIYDIDGKPTILPELLTEENLIKAIRKGSQGSSTKSSSASEISSPNPT